MHHAPLAMLISPVPSLQTTHFILCNVICNSVSLVQVFPCIVHSLHSILWSPVPYVILYSLFLPTIMFLPPSPYCSHTSPCIFYCLHIPFAKSSLAISTLFTQHTVYTLRTMFYSICSRYPMIQSQC